MDSVTLSEFLFLTVDSLYLCLVLFKMLKFSIYLHKTLINEYWYAFVCDFVLIYGYLESGSNNPALERRKIQCSRYLPLTVTVQNDEHCHACDFVTSRTRFSEWGSFGTL